MYTPLLGTFVLRHRYKRTIPVNSCDQVVL